MVKGLKIVTASALLLILLLSSISCGAEAVNTKLSNTHDNLQVTSSEPVEKQAPDTPSSRPATGSQTFPDEWHLNEWVIHGIETRPKEAAAGEEVDIWTNIYSANNDYSFASAFLIINGHVFESRDIIIPPDEDYPFLFSFTPVVPGEYDICVRVVCETKVECIDPFDTQAYLVDAFITIHVTD